jgi:ubiquinone/menaquinone biosynthesis C-methylase UbiE
VSEFAIETSYEPFSREPEYVEANREFVRGLELAGRRTMLDIACGTGTITDLVLEARPGIGVSGIDISHESLLLAQQHFAGREPACRPRLVEGSAAALPFPAASFDAAIMGNAIHNLPDAGALLREIRRVLRPGGVFAFNTSFYAGTFPPGTERFYHLWLRHAVSRLMAEDRARRARGEAGVPRTRRVGRPAFSVRWRTPAEWSDELRGAGFAATRFAERTVMMSHRSFALVGAYAGLASVLLSGYPVELAAEALQDSVAPALAELGVDAVPRLWLEMFAACEAGSPSP